MNDIYGNIHSFESFGTVDGPGVRFVVFMQGCGMRCLYCHNPDTWEFNKNKKYTAAEILQKYEGVKEFCKGGLTVSGGEPLFQVDFVIELFKQTKKRGIHTALDTSGVTFDFKAVEKFDNLMQYTDLVLLDIKHINDEEHKKLTGYSNKSVLEFAKYLSDKSMPVWIRHVVVPQITFDKRYLNELGGFLSKLKNVKALEVLPYHDMAKSKYKELKMEYKIENIPPLTKEQALEARKYIIEGINSKQQI